LFKETKRASSEMKSLLNEAQILAIFFSTDVEACTIAESSGATAPVDKMELNSKLILAIKHLGSPKTQTARPAV
jgi:hypothetical protein